MKSADQLFITICCVQNGLFCKLVTDQLHTQRQTGSRLSAGNTDSRQSEIPALFRDGTLPLDVALINVSPPDAEGYCSFGVSADLAVSAVECAKTVIAQVNRAMPYSYGDAVIHVSRLAAAVEVDSPLVEVPTAVPSETERKIGSYIAELIPDGATLQIGVGGIPNAVLAALGGHRHLGLHTEATAE